MNTETPKTQEVREDRLYDNTRISTYRACPRQFYFRHMMDFTRIGTAKPLVFGGCWHDAMDVVWTLMCEDSKRDSIEVVEEAMRAFMVRWREEGFPDIDDFDEETLAAYNPRTPMVAMEMLFNYVEDRRSHFSEIELIAVEKPFAVPLDPNDDSLFYVGRLDKVYRWKRDDRIYIGEHKTTTSYKKDGPFRYDFMDSFSPNSQIDGYLFAAHMLYGKELKAVWIDAALVHKTVHDGFRFIPVERQFAQLEAWLWEAHDWIAKLERDKADAIDGDREANYMAAFPKNTSSCNAFTGCQFAELCKTWSNPYGRTPPDTEFKREHWSPFDVLKLQELGLKVVG